MQNWTYYVARIWINTLIVLLCALGITALGVFIWSVITQPIMLPLLIVPAAYVLLVALIDLTKWAMRTIEKEKND